MAIKKLSNKDWQLLSDLLDGQLTSDKHSLVMRRLEKEPDLRTAYENLHWTKSLMRQVPRRKVPHNYILTRQMAAEAKQKAGGKRSHYSLASVLASLIFVVLLAIQLVPNLPFYRSTSKMAQSDETALRDMVVEEAAAEEPAMGLMAAPESIEAETMPEEESELAVTAADEAEDEEVPMLEAFSSEASSEDSEELSGSEEVAADEAQTMLADDFGAIEEREPINWLFIATVVSGLVAFALAFINQKNRRNF